MNNTTASSGIPREIPELLASLRRHVKLLKEYSVRAFRDHDQDYLGEISGKLRLLVCKFGRHKPLLQALMDEFELNIRITIDGPPNVQSPPDLPSVGDQISLQEYLALPAYGIKTSTGFVEITKEQLIRVWAEKHGPAHEDWSLPEEFVTAINTQILIFGLSPIEHELKVTTETVLFVADEFLNSIDQTLIDLKTAERILKRDPNSVNALNAHGVALTKLERHEEALEDFQKMIQIDPMNPQGHNNTGAALYHLGRISEAIKAFKDAVKVDSNYIDAHYSLASLYSVQHDFKKCLDELQSIKELTGLTGDNNPVSDPDFENIREDKEYGPIFFKLVG